MQDINDLELIIASDVPIIVIESHDEKRALMVLTRLAMKRHLGVQVWTLTDGFTRTGFGEDAPEETGEPEKALEHLKKNGTGGLAVFCDIHPFLENPKIVRLIKDMAINYAIKEQTIVLLSHALTIPAELKRFVARFQLRLPSDEELMAMVREEAADWSQSNAKAKVKTDNKTLQQMIVNLRGLGFDEARRLIRGAIFNDGAIAENDIAEVNKAKFELLDMQGVISFEYRTAKFSEVGGLNKLKKWLQDRQAAFMDTKGKDAPRGILLSGVQGGGKSLAAKAVAGLWSLPLLRLDMGALYNKFVGESERNLRESLKLAEMMAPCVLWLDEIEKGFASDDHDAGVTQRMLGTFLTWLSERTKPVFVVSTANDIMRLPPELVRKGRFDELFFVDLPSKPVREQIFSIHLQKRGLDVTTFNLSALADAADGFSGAEIEQAVVSSLYTIATDKQPLTTEHVIQEIHNTSPLSVVMAEKLAALRAWATERAVAAD